MKNVSAIILAAGLSQRMAAFKPLLTLGSKSALQHCIDLFKSAGIDRIIVVTGHRQELLLNTLDSSQVKAIHNRRYAEGMFSSISAGLTALDDGCSAFFVLPVDIPLIRTATVQQLLMNFSDYQPLVSYPNFNGHRGHPPLISAHLIPEISAWQGSGGLGGFLRRCESRAIDVPVADETILWDMDTPNDYQRLVIRAKRYDIPTEKECRALMQQVYRATGQVQAHCRMVVRVAQSLGKALLDAGLSLDMQRLIAAASVHDIARGRPHHAQLGAKWLRHWEFDGVAPLVEQHMTLKSDQKAPLNEFHILYLADKLVQEDRIVDVDVRFQTKLDHYAGDAAIAKRIGERWRAAHDIRKQIETVVGFSLERILVSVFYPSDMPPPT